jgi:hypothetical protein
MLECQLFTDINSVFPSFAFAWCDCINNWQDGDIKGNATYQDSRGSTGREFLFYGSVIAAVVQGLP